MADGRIPRSSLVNVVLHELELDAPEELIAWTAQASREAFKQQAARLFPAVASLALGGDAESTRILDAARAHLLRSCRGCHRPAGTDRIGRSRPAGLRRRHLRRQ
jgi:N-acetylglucosamine kinase-like BadF-type ATPase